MNLTLVLALFFMISWTKSSKNDSDTSVTSESSFESESDSSDTDDSDKSRGKAHLPFEIFLPYRLDYLAEMKLTTMFPRKFLYTLRDYKGSKNSGVPVLSMPNCYSGALRLGAVQLPSRRGMNNFLSMMEELSRRVYRTGLNKTTAGGNFRLPIKGLAIDPATRLVYTKIDVGFPTDSHGRYVKFMKSLYYRLAKSQLHYEIDEDIQLDRIVLGMVNNLADIDLKAFEKTFKNFQVGFLTIGKVVVRPPGRGGDRYKSIFYFDHNSYEPIIGIENTIEEDENINRASVNSTKLKHSSEPKKKKKNSKSKSGTRKKII